MNGSSSAERESAGPWGAEDIVRWSTTVLLGLALVAVGGFEAHSQKLFHHQFSWTALATAGAIAVFYGNAVWLLRGRRRIGERMHSLLRSYDPAQARRQAVGESGIQSTGRVPDRGELVAPLGATYFHRPRCPLARGRETVSASRAGHAAAGRVPCGVCAP